MLGMVILSGHASMKPVNSSFRGNPCFITKLYSLKYKVSLVWCMWVAHECYAIFVMREGYSRHHRAVSHARWWAIDFALCVLLAFWYMLYTNRLQNVCVTIFSVIYIGLTFLHKKKCCVLRNLISPWFMRNFCYNCCTVCAKYFLSN